MFDHRIEDGFGQHAPAGRGFGSLSRGTQGNQSADKQSSRDLDTVDLMKSKVGRYSQSTDRANTNDELLNIIGSNLGDVSLQLRNSLATGQHTAGFARPEDDDLGFPEDEGPPPFDFKMVQMYAEWFEEEFLEKEKTDNRTLVYLVSQIDSSQTKARVGALCQIYKLIYSSDLDRPEDLRTVVYSLADFLKTGQFRDCPYTLFVVLEVIYFVGADTSDAELPALLADLVVNFETVEVKRKAIRLLFSLGLDGLGEILHLCSSGQDVCQLVVELLINEPVVLETILVPAMLNQFHSADTKLQTKAICCLGKLGNLASRSETIPLLSDLLLNSPVDKTMLIAALRAMGDRGERELNKLFKKAKSNKVRSLICYFLGQKVPVEFLDEIQIVSFE